MAKAAEIHFEPDGVIHLFGASTPNSPDFVPVITNTVSRLAAPEVQTEVMAVDHGSTLAVHVRIGPKGWQAARKKAEAEAKAKAEAEAKAAAKAAKPARKKPGPQRGAKAKRKARSNGKG